MESRQRPSLFENLIKDPPSHGPQAPIGNGEFEKINRYVERARNLKEALIEFDDALLEQWEDFLRYHRDCRLSQHVFAGSHGVPVTEANLNMITALAARLTELSQHHEELRAQVEELARIGGLSSESYNTPPVHTHPTHVQSA